MYKLLTLSITLLNFSVIVDINDLVCNWYETSYITINQQYLGNYSHYIDLHYNRFKRNGDTQRITKFFTKSLIPLWVRQILLPNEESEKHYYKDDMHSGDDGGSSTTQFI
jgi:hypothetical protein